MTTSPPTPASAPPPLNAVVARRNGTYVVTVAGTEIGDVVDLPSATTLLCVEAAKYQRRVYVTVHISNLGRETLEIEPDGTINRTAPPAPTSAEADQIQEFAVHRAATLAAPGTTTTPGVGLQVHRAATGAGPADPDTRLIADGAGYPAVAGVAENPDGGRRTSSTRWALRTHKASIVQAVVALTCLIAAAAITNVNSAATSASDERTARLTSVTELPPKKLDSLTRETSPRAGSDALTQVKQYVTSRGGQWRVTRTDAPVPVESAAGTTTDAGELIAVTATKTDAVELADLLRTLSPALEVVTFDATTPGTVTAELRTHNVRE